jgi:ABC-type enterochelin transport system ATPase subunit
MTGHFNEGFSRSIRKAKCFPENFEVKVFTLQTVMKRFLKTLSGGHDQKTSCAYFPHGVNFPGTS